MLVETKAKVGVFAIALGAYLPQFPTLVPEFETQYDAFKKTIPDTVEMIDGGIVTTKELSMEAGDKFRAADVDLVILQLLTYATSYNMLPAVRDLNVPVVLVNVQKRKAPDYANTDTPKWLGELYACGAVGEMVADLERAGKRHAVITGVVEGGDAYVAKEIDEWCRAAQVRRRFRYTNIAQIGRPYPGMMDLYIDETNLYNRMGLYTKQFDWEKIWAIADPVTDEAAIRAKAEEILDTFDIEGGATIETVWDMAKYVVAFEEWVKKEDLGMVASHYDGFAKGVAGKLDSMLIPAFSMLIKQGTACAVEGDMKVAMAMSILKTIAGTGQLSEMYSIDFNEDICIIGHSGSGDADISQAKKPSMKIVDVFHGKTGGGYLTQFYPPVGDVTYLGITQDKDGHFKFVAAEGVNEDGPIFTFGDTNMRTRFSIGAREFCNRWSEAGPTHHMAAAVGHHIDTILKVAKILDVPVEVVCRYISIKEEKREKEEGNNMKFLDAEFVKGFIRMANDGWEQGWHERNGGNLSYRVKPEEVEEVKENFEAREWNPIGTAVPNLAGEYFLVTGSGKYFRNVTIKPEDSICMIELDEKGENYRIVWGLVNGGRPTSELPSHLMNLEVKKLQDERYRVVYHAHTTNVIALTFVLPLEDKVFTRELWEMATECPVVFPSGIGVVPWMVPGGREIAVATSELMKKYDLAIWAHHGMFAAGFDFDLTFGLMHTAEKSAEILVKTLSMQPTKRQTITPDEFRHLAKDFGVTLPEEFLYEK